MSDSPAADQAASPGALREPGRATATWMGLTAWSAMALAPAAAAEALGAQVARARRLAGAGLRLGLQLRLRLGLVRGLLVGRRLVRDLALDDLLLALRLALLDAAEDL